jgi:hypothetical protein
MESLGEDLRRTSRQVEAYAVSEHVIRVGARSLRRLPVAERKGIEIRELRRAIVFVAEAHQGCAVPACVSCEAIRNGLAVALAVVRAEADGGFEESMRD